jgi:hypothetical protein
MSTQAIKDSELCRIIEAYAAFEVEINAYAAKLWQPFCSACKSVCCKPEYCRESLESPFLARLRECYHPNRVFRSDAGWLTETGCSLNRGRPSVCYQFLCDNILQAQVCDEQRYLMNVFSNLINHVGKRALGHRHLIAIMDCDRIEQLKYNRFAVRLNEARRAFEQLQRCWEQDFIDEGALKVLAKITPPPPAIYDSLR